MPRSNHNFSLSNNNKISKNFKFSHTELILTTKSGVLFIYLFIYLSTLIYLPHPIPQAHPQPPPATLKPRNPHPQLFTLKSAFLNQKSPHHYHPPHYTLSRWTRNEFENQRNLGILGDQPNHNKQSWNQLQRIPTDNKEDSTPDFKYFITCCPIL